MSETLSSGYRQINLRSYNYSQGLEGGIHVEDGATGDYTFVVTGDMVVCLNTEGFTITGEGFTTSKITYNSTSSAGSQNSIWTGNNSWGDWGKVIIKSEHFRNAKAGDKLYLRYTEDNPSDLYLRYAYDYGETEFDPQPTRNKISDGEYIVLTDDILEQWKTNNKQVVIKGKNYTVTSVELVEGSESTADKELWTGEVVCTSYDGIGDVYGSDIFHGYKAGDVIAITTSASGSSGYVQILTPGYQWLASKSFSAAGIIEIALTDNIINYAKQIGLRIQGNDCTVTKVELLTQKASVTIGETGWATLSSDKILDFSGTIENLDAAYIITGVDGSSVTTKEIDGAIAAGQGILLKGSGEVKIPIANTATFDATGNLLMPGAGAKVTSGYVLSKDGSTAVFKKIASIQPTVEVGKAYLAISASAPQLSIFGGDGETTGISGVQVEKAVKGEVYDLQGRRVQNPTKGLYIVGGKKVVVK